MEDPTPEETDEAGRSALALLSFVVIWLCVIYFGAIFCFRDVPVYFGLNLDQKLSGLGEIVFVLTICLIVITILHYFAYISWMILGKVFFSRSDIKKIIEIGFHTQLDLWLLQKIYPEKN